MNDSTKSQVDLIMKKYCKIKVMYLELKSTNKRLEEVVDAFRARHKKTDQQRFDLIKMFKNSVIRNQDIIKSLQKENAHLQGTIQDQNQVIQEFSNTIDNLNKEINLLKEKSEYEKVTAQSNSRTSFVKKEFNGNIGILDHPSFDLTNETNVQKKRKTKTRLFSQSRWSNLDVTVKGKKISKENCVTKAEDSLITSQKKRKLYCDSDSVVDLENDVEG